jgi:hypothetical protein
MPNKLIVRKLSTRVEGKGQTVDFIEHAEIVVEPEPEFVGQDVKRVVHKLRVHVSSDSYPQQSFGRIERWDGARWNSVAEIAGDALKVPCGIGYERLTEEELTDAFLADAMHLHALAIEVLL